MKKQSTQDKLKRIAKHCCPVHGLFESQDGDMFTNMFFTYSKCPRKDCDQRMVKSRDGNMVVNVALNDKQIDELLDYAYASFNEWNRRFTVSLDERIMKCNPLSEVADDGLQ